MFFLDGMWAWWLGAMGLAVVCVGYSFVLNRPCSVSGIWAVVVNWREERAAAEAEAAMAADPEAVEKAMLEAVMQELGGEIPEELRAQLEEIQEPDEEPHCGDFATISVPHPCVCSGT